MKQRMRSLSERGLCICLGFSRSETSASVIVSSQRSDGHHLPTLLKNYNSLLFSQEREKVDRQKQDIAFFMIFFCRQNNGLIYFA